MISGFQYNGRHSSEFNLYYIPAAQDMILAPPTFDQREETVTGKSGGYFYGRQTEIRDITQSCYFEDIPQATVEEMIGWLYEDSEGELIFDERPYVKYRVRPAKPPAGQYYDALPETHTHELFSGTLTIYFRAYSPFGEMTQTAYDTRDELGASATTGIIAKADMPAGLSAATGTYYVYNPGTAITGTIIRIGGTVGEGGVTITNDTTREECRQVGLPKTTSTYIEQNSDTGMVRELPTGDKETAFEYHDSGFINLAPCTPFRRRVIASYTALSNIVTFPLITLSERNVGQFLHIGGTWVWIITVQSEHSAVISQNMKTSGIEETVIATMNQITISGSGVSLNKLELEYIPKVR